MDSFSWSDTFRALASPCLACLRVAHPHPYLPDQDPYAQRIRTDDLEGLLADSGSSTDAETLSLHSNIGSGQPRRKKRRFTKHISLFGWDLFGKPPIQLPEDDDDEADAQRERRRARMGRTATLSSSTLDSDAAPLDPSAIPERATEHEDELEREQREEAERRARKHERKELRRAARALSLQRGGADAEPLEGFPGSGGHARIHSPFVGSSRTDSDSVGSRSGAAPGAEDDDDAADFGGHAYTRRAASSGSAHGSDSRSRTSATRSSQAGEEYNHPFFSQPSPTPMPTYPAPAAAKPKRSKKSSRSSKSSKSASSASASATMSPSLASPVMPQFPEPQALDAQEFEGFPNDLGVVTSGLGDEVMGGGFPSPGLGGPRPGSKRDMGAFLARRE